MTDKTPQLEGGFFRIANELAEAMAQARLSGREHRVMWAVLRNTYGWNRKYAECSISWLAKATGLDRAASSRTRASLLKKGFLKRDTKHSKQIGINKQYIKKVLSKQQHQESAVKTTAEVLSKQQQKCCQNNSAWCCQNNSQIKTVLKTVLKTHLLTLRVRRCKPQKQERNHRRKKQREKPTRESRS